jgi:5,10-methylenetetrahydromethanopterin reductase
LALPEHAEQPGHDATTGWGVWLHAVRPLSELARLGQHAEELGASAILVADEGTDRDLYVTLASIAAHTKRALLFAAVTNPHSRHPVASAAALAALAELAPGRIVAGFGAGGSRVFGPMGLHPQRPYTALVECVQTVDALLRGEVVDHEGEFTVKGAALPWAPGPLPIAIAGRGPRVERLAAERADWILLAGRAVARVGELVDSLRAMAIGSGRTSAPAIAWNPTPAWTEPMRADLRGHLAYMAVDMPPEERLALGLTDDLRARLRQTINTHGPEAAVPLVPDAVLAHYAVLGDKARVIEQLRELRQRVRPELFVFDVGDYSVTFLDELAEVAVAAGRRVVARS